MRRSVGLDWGRLGLGFADTEAGCRRGLVYAGDRLAIGRLRISGAWTVTALRALETEFLKDPRPRHLHRVLSAPQDRSHGERGAMALLAARRLESDAFTLPPAQHEHFLHHARHATARARDDESPRVDLNRKSADGGTRTHTTVSGQGILSPLCLPFHHIGGTARRRAARSTVPGRPDGRKRRVRGRRLVATPRRVWNADSHQKPGRRQETACHLLKEALRVRWKDVDFDRQLVAIGADGQAKNAEVRHVDFNPALSALLTAMKTFCAPGIEMSTLGFHRQRRRVRAFDSRRAARGLVVGEPVRGWVASTRSYCLGLGVRRSGPWGAVAQSPPWLALRLGEEGGSD